MATMEVEMSMATTCGDPVVASFLHQALATSGGDPVAADFLHQDLATDVASLLSLSPPSSSWAEATVVFPGDVVLGLGLVIVKVAARSRPGLGWHGTTVARRALGRTWASPEASRADTA